MFLKTHEDTLSHETVVEWSVRIHPIFVQVSPGHPT